MNTLPMTTEEAAAFLNISRKTLYKNKELKRTKRFGKSYYNREDLLAYLGVQKSQ